MAYQRDPVSVLFDAGARRLLDRAYAKPGTWVGTRLENPGVRHMAWLISHGIVWDAPDDPSAQGGKGLDCKTRWARGFVRALYYQHKWYSGETWRSQRRTSPRNSGGLVVEVGRARPSLGVIPAGRAIRIKLEPGGRAKEKAVRATAERDRWTTGAFGSREPGPRWSDPDKRDW